MPALMLGMAVTGGVGLVLFPPLLLVTAALFVALVVAQMRWDAATTALRSRR